MAKAPLPLPQLKLPMTWDSILNDLRNLPPPQTSWVTRAFIPCSFQKLEMPPRNGLVIVIFICRMYLCKGESELQVECDVQIKPPLVPVGSPTCLCLPLPVRVPVDAPSYLCLPSPSLGILLTTLLLSSSRISLHFYFSPTIRENAILCLIGEFVSQVESEVILKKNHFNVRK